MSDKPNATVTFVGYEVRLDNCVHQCRTKEEAEMYAKEWEALEIDKWEKENSQATKDIRRNAQFWTDMNYFVRDLKTDAQQYGKMGLKDKVDTVRNIREKIEHIIKRVDDL